MATLYRGLLGAAGMAGCIGLGVALWAAAAPDEARLKEMTKNYPEANVQVYEERQQQNALVMEILKEAAETDENVASRKWPWRK
ncbi:Ubiquinol-cytochrome-c reductase complex assembly factor 3 [Varanus komodoensis]|uniref:ubiquinol-cytochrome-c reductase complex assembly factor 3-like n=1 Tax=Varanus komodoensis TaxID=61221 RepID=UPI001CF7EC52|nr:ubiquinol-cytochrome-c reductase complex assembly factor 3-like [Varanus komodoensis]KAF7238513.1 Ubiquinol-cytochrome-c reductase complex assembly factor 3 [Varanus komodoensis]